MWVKTTGFVDVSDSTSCWKIPPVAQSLAWIFTFALPPRARIVRSVPSTRASTSLVRTAPRSTVLDANTGVRTPLVIDSGFAAPV